MYHQAYIDYLIHFHTDRDYFECHEILEELWKQDSVLDRNKSLVGLIQIAVGMYHYRRNNLIGARKMFQRVLKKIYVEFEELTLLGLDIDILSEILQNQINRINSQKAYQSIHLPLKKDLLQICLEQCKINHLTWNQQSDMSKTYLIHKHSLRNKNKS